MYNRTIFDGFQFKKDLNHQVEGVPNGRVGVSERCQIISQLLHQKF